MFGLFSSNKTNSFNVGQNIQARYGNKWYKATIVKIEQKSLKIEWYGEGKSSWIKAQDYQQKIKASNKKSNSNSSQPRNGHGNGHGQYQQQQQQQIFASNKKQMQRVADVQMFCDQVDNTFDSVIIAAKISANNELSDVIKNKMTDGAILTLEMFAISCLEFRNENNKDAVQLAIKSVTDKWDKLQLTNPKLFKLTKMYRDFLITQLNSNKSLKFNSFRIGDIDEEEEKMNYKNNPNRINKSYQQIIGSNCKFSKKMDTYFDPETNKKLNTKHKSELKEYKKNKNKYKIANDEKDNYARPNQADFYFTESGKKSKFRSNNYKEQDHLDNAIFGLYNAYDHLPTMDYPNSVVRFSKNYPLKLQNQTITTPIPCKLIYPNKDDLKKNIKLIAVRLAYPINNMTLDIDPNRLIFNQKEIIKYENKHMNSDQLGYKSVTELENKRDNQLINGVGNMDMDIDITNNEDGPDITY